MAVTVFPSAPDPSHDISLTDGTLTYGFTFAGGPRVFQEIPLSPPAQSFEVQQRNWVGGRGAINIKDDATGFFDSQNMWTSSEERAFPSLRWKYSNLAGEEGSTTGTSHQWYSLISSLRYVAKSFVSTGTAAMDRVSFQLRRVGTPGTLTVELCSDNATPGSPGTVLQTVTMAASTIPDLVSVYKAFDWTGTQAKTNATTYWIKVYCAAADSTANHWELYCDSSSDHLVSANGTSWVSSSPGLSFRVSIAPYPRRWFRFTLGGLDYIVSKDDNHAASTLLMNGFRGIASAGASTTLTCAQTCTRDYSGAYISIIGGTGDGQIRQITSNTTGASVVFTVPAWDVTPDTTSIFIVYGTDFWDTCTGTSGLGYVTGQPVVSSSHIVYFPQGLTVAVRRMRLNGNSHDFAAEATYKSDYLYINTDEFTGTQIWGINATNCKVHNANIVTWGTHLVPISETVIGTENYRITNAINYEGDLIFFKEDGLYKFDGTRVTRIGRNFENIPDSSNGMSADNDNAYLWFTWGHSVERMLGKNVTDMLNWRAGYDGLPDNRRGVITTIFSVIGWMFCVVDGGASNYSSIIYWSGSGWHELFRGFETGIRIRTAWWQPCPGTNPRLWVDINGELLHIKFPKNGSVPINDSSLSYNPEGVLITSIIDIGSLETYKIIKSIKIFQDKTSATQQPVYVDYQTNANVNTATWTYLGLADATPFEEITMNIGGINRIRFRFRIYGDNLTTPSVLVGWAITGREMPVPKYQYIGTFVAGTDRDTNQGDVDVSTDITYAWLKTCATNQTKLTLRTLLTSSDSKVVTVSMPVKNVDWVDEGNWGGRISFSMMEV